MSYLILLITEKLLGRLCSSRGTSLAFWTLWAISEGLKDLLLELDPILIYPA